MAEQKTLVELLPKICADGKKEAQAILDRLSSESRVSLQTNEMVLPSKDNTGLFRGQIKEIDEKEWFNRLIYGDNLLAMQALLAGDPASGLPPMRGKIDLVYIDPPFDSKADYRTKIVLPKSQDNSQEIEQKPTVIEQFAYSDTWKDGTASYLKMIYPRLVLMRELLSDQGSIYVHIDWHVGHYVKIILDDIFGKENFRNQIIWQRTRAAHSDSRFYGKVHDMLLFYTKSATNFYFKSAYTKHKDEYLIRFNKTDENGRRYMLVPLHAPGQGVARIFSSKQINPPKGRMWPSQRVVDDYISKGIVEFTSTGTPSKKSYLDENKGAPISDIWGDIIPLNPVASERVNYDTQKPEALLNRIVESSCPEMGIVADFFAGSSTTGAVAEKLGRKWIMCDLGKPACMISRKRLIDQDAKPFLYQSIGDYQKEQFEKSEYRRIGDLAHVVLNLYGALPFPHEQTPNRNLGYIKTGKTLVFVDSPSKMTGYATLKKAQELRNTFLGGWEKVVVLGWNFVTDIGQQISALKDEKLEVLVIPADLLDKLKTKANYDKLIKSGQIRFSSLQYLTVKPVKKESPDEGDEITIELDNYVLLSPNALPLEDEEKTKVQALMAKDPLALIEYWSIDPDYDGKVFRSKWQDYRENEENKERGVLRVVKKVKLTVPKVKGKRKVCVKTVDVFGFESAAVQEV